MKTERKDALFNNMLDYITEIVCKTDLKIVLKGIIGFTDDEIKECGIEIEDEFWEKFNEQNRLQEDLAIEQKEQM